MLNVSMGALVSLVVIMLICFVLPFALFYVLYRFADGRVKTLLLGAAAYLFYGVILDTVLVTLLEFIGGINTNGLIYMLYAVLISPCLFIAVNYFGIRKFGRGRIKTTGDSMMYSLGYSTALNILTTGFVSIMYFLTLIDIKNRGGLIHWVSDADYVSESNAVSSSNLVTKTIYDEMVLLCDKPVSYYMQFVVSSLWAIAAYAAVMMVIWLAVKKAQKKILLAFAFIIRLFLTLPEIPERFGLITNPWIIQGAKIAVLVIAWAAAIFCRKNYIDSPDE